MRPHDSAESQSYIFALLQRLALLLRELPRLRETDFMNNTRLALAAALVSISSGYACDTL